MKRNQYSKELSFFVKWNSLGITVGRRSMKCVSTILFEIYLFVYLCILSAVLVLKLLVHPVVSNKEGDR